MKSSTKTMTNPQGWQSNHQPQRRRPIMTMSRRRWKWYDCWWNWPQNCLSSAILLRFFRFIWPVKPMRPNVFSSQDGTRSPGAYTLQLEQPRSKPLQHRNRRGCLVRMRFSLVRTTVATRTVSLQAQEEPIKSDRSSCQLSQWTSRTTTRNRVLLLPHRTLPNNQRSHKRRRPSSFILLTYLFPVALTTTSQETSTTSTSCRSIASSIAHACKQAAPHRDVLLLNASSAETLLHDNNTVEQHCWTLTTTSFVPRTQLSSSTNNTTTTTSATGHVLAIIEALPPTSYECLVLLEHVSPEAVVWSNGFARRSRNGAIRVSVSCLSWNRPTVWLAYHTAWVEGGSLRLLV